MKTLTLAACLLAFAGMAQSFKPRQEGTNSVLYWIGPTNEVAIATNGVFTTETNLPAHDLQSGRMLAASLYGTGGTTNIVVKTNSSGFVYTNTVISRGAP